MFQVLWSYWMLWYNPSGQQGETENRDWVLTVSRWEEAITRANLLMEAAQRVCLFVIFKQVGEKRPPRTYNMKQNVENVFTLF